MATLEDEIKNVFRIHSNTFNLLFAESSVLLESDIINALRRTLPPILELKSNKPQKWTLFPLIVIYQLICNTPMVKTGNSIPFEYVIKALSTLDQSRVNISGIALTNFFLGKTIEREALSKKSLCSMSKLNFVEFVRMIMESRKKQEEDRDVERRLMESVASDAQSASAAQSAPLFDMLDVVPGSSGTPLSYGYDMITQQAIVRKVEGASANKLKSEGFTATHLRKAGYSKEELNAAGFSMNDLKDAEDAAAGFRGGKSRRRRHSIKKSKSKSKLKSKLKSKSKSRYNKVRKTRRYRK